MANMETETYEGPRMFWHFIGRKSGRSRTSGCKKFNGLKMVEPQEIVYFLIKDRAPVVGDPIYVRGSSRIQFGTTFV